MDLSILCVTKNEPFAEKFLEAFKTAGSSLDAEVVILVDRIDVQSKGYIESVLDEAVSRCSREYILRLDDDESISPAMFHWLWLEEYRQENHWKFPRIHLWPDEKSALFTAHLFPDEQTRLSVRHMAGGRSTVHAGSPFGGGHRAPVAIFHHKFIVRSKEERLTIARRYDSFMPGYGTGNMKPFSLPEEYYDRVKLVEAGNGNVPWKPEWEKTVSI